jgi:hypothetical protein
MAQVIFTITFLRSLVQSMCENYVILIKKIQIIMVVIQAGYA